FPFRPEYFPELELKLRYTVAFLQNVAFCGLLSILAFHVTKDWRYAALSLLTAVSMFAVRSLVGFILDLPPMSAALIHPHPGPAPATEDETKKVSPISFNNNLVDISDWITKSVLTLSIANYEKIVPSLQGAAAYLALDATENARTEAMLIIIAYSCI